MTIRIILADDHNVLRAGLHAMLEKHPEMEVIAQADNGRDTVELVRKHSPDVVVMDIGMAQLNGVEATRQIRADGNRVKVLALSMHSDKRYVLAMLKAGASGYLLKNCAFQELTRAIDTIVANQTYLSPAIAGLVLDELKKPDFQDQSEQTVYSILTAREREVLQLLAEGKSTKQVAANLHISVSTVETHRRQLMEKLDIHSIAELTKYALREGLTTLET